MSLPTYQEWYSTARRSFVWKHLVDARGNQLVAAEAMAVHRNTLKRMMLEEGITPEMVRTIRQSLPGADTNSLIPTTLNIYRTNERKHSNV